MRDLDANLSAVGAGIWRCWHQAPARGIEVQQTDLCASPEQPEHYHAGTAPCERNVGPIQAAVQCVIWPNSLNQT